MKMQVVFKNLKDEVLRNKIRTYAEKRLSNLTRYSHHIINGELTFEEGRGQYETVLMVHVKGANLTAKARSKDPLESIDRVKDKIKSQLKKYEEKLKLEDRRKNNEKTFSSSPL